MSTNKNSEDSDLDCKAIISCFIEKISLDIFDPLFQELINTNR